MNTCKTPVMQGIGPAATVALDAHTQLTEVRERVIPHGAEASPLTLARVRSVP